MLTTNRCKPTTVLCVLAVLVTAWHAVALADKPDPVESKLAPEVIEDILRLRRSLSGPPQQGDSLPGSATLASEEQFRAALKQLASDLPDRPAPADLAPVDPPRTVTRSTELPAIPDSPAPVDLGNRIPSHVETIESNPDVELAASLRHSSRLLDNRAHDLDAERRFDESDRLRRLASRLRKDARRIESTSSAHEVLVPSR